ncbi:hypothetical protein [Azospirillum soli]|uniref:hypothetical protein n=1 Tax=Azospirillum soli TaxID=1304799 RepID=UPI001AE458D1|nr:hypothetical protein [Azospirillum soli]MBP2315442.1 hypothetical protein [Azospirillum soli]
MTARDNIESIAADPTSREYAEIRDRLTYTFLTGAIATHLRPLTARLVVQASQLGLSGFVVRPQYVRAFALEDQPMTKTVKDYAARGFVVRGARTIFGRRPYGRVWMAKQVGSTVVQVTINRQGFVREGWV